MYIVWADFIVIEREWVIEEIGWNRRKQGDAVSRLIIWKHKVTFIASSLFGLTRLFVQTNRVRVSTLNAFGQIGQVIIEGYLQLMWFNEYSEVPKKILT